MSRKEAQFGRGRDSLYRIGVNRDLIGSTVALTSSELSGPRIRIEDESLLTDTRTTGDVVPARISGVVEEGKIDPGIELAVAVNGRIQALTRCFEDEGVQRFRAMVPESALREGRNQGRRVRDRRSRARSGASSASEGRRPDSPISDSSRDA